MSFGGDLQGFSRKTGITLDKIVRKTVIDMTRAIVVATPVDTGLAKNNWFWGTNRVTSIEAGASKNGSASNGRASDFAGTIRGGGVYYLTNNLPYIMALEYGGYHGPTKKVTAGGYSTQAPAGMARITVARWQGIVNEAVRLCS